MQNKKGKKLEKIPKKMEKRKGIKNSIGVGKRNKIH